MIAPRLKNRIKDYIRKTGMLETGDHVILCVSGGADSVFLCVLMKELAEETGISLAAVHVHHGIRGADADADEEFVRRLCRMEEIPLSVYHRNVPREVKRTGETLEEAGRRMRYECFRDAAAKWADDISTEKTDAENGSAGKTGTGNINTGKAEAENSSAEKTETGDSSAEESEGESTSHIRIALAHHMDDQAETVLFRIVRGTGIRGLKGMEPVRRDGRWTVIRPLLCARREEIRNELRENGISWREDATNADDEAARNRIRHDIIPLMENEINSRSVEHLAELAKRASEAYELIQRDTDLAEKKLLRRPDPAETDLGREISGEPTAIRRELVLRAVSELAGKRKDLGSRHVAAVLGLVDAEEGSRVDLPYGLTAVSTENGVKILKYGTAEEETESSDKEPEKPGGESGNSDRVSGGIAGEPVDPNAVPRDPGAAPKGPDVRLVLMDRAPDPIPQIKYTKWIDYDKINNTTAVRTRETGDYLVIDEKGHKKSLSDYFTDEKVPKNLRDHITLVADGHEIIWVVGYRIGYRYRVTGGTKRVLMMTADGE